MGLLDDAIREHLELKRRHGASPEEVAAKEAEALGPVRGPARPAPHDAAPDDAAPDDAAPGESLDGLGSQDRPVGEDPAAAPVVEVVPTLDDRPPPPDPTEIATPPFAPGEDPAHRSPARTAESALGDVDAAAARDEPVVAPPADEPHDVADEPPAELAAEALGAAEEEPSGSLASPPVEPAEPAALDEPPLDEPSPLGEPALDEPPLDEPSPLDEPPPASAPPPEATRVWQPRPPAAPPAAADTPSPAEPPAAEPPLAPAPADRPFTGDEPPAIRPPLDTDDSPAPGRPAPQPFDDTGFDDEPDEVPAGESLALPSRADESLEPADDEPADDLLEETPEFLQDTPEHDRLWFEQRPPRDFDFD